MIRRVAALLGTAVLGGGAVWVAAYAAGYRARPDLCVAAGLAIALCVRLAGLVLAPPEPPAPAPDREPPGDGLLVLSSLESLLSWGAADPDRFRSRVRPLLVELATERLRTRRGIDPARQPDPARRVLGEPLWQLMTVPPARSPDRAELDRLVAAIERI